jgi:hypothetical protein
MKHCPACNFRFPDFHLVCDFDGTELVPERQQLALIKVQRRLLIPRWLTSPKTVTALAIIGLFFIAAVIAFQQTTSRSARTLLAANVATPRLEPPAITTSRELSAPSAPVSRSNRTTARSTRAQRSSPVRVVVKSRPEKRNELTSSATEVAHRSETAPSEKQPRVVAILKTTWRVLKRPFSF